MRSATSRASVVIEQRGVGEARCSQTPIKTTPYAFPLSLTGGAVFGLRRGSFGGGAVLVKITRAGRRDFNIAVFADKFCAGNHSIAASDNSTTIRRDWRDKTLNKSTHTRTAAPAAAAGGQEARPLSGAGSRRPRRPHGGGRPGGRLLFTGFHSCSKRLSGKPMSYDTFIPSILYLNLWLSLAVRSHFSHLLWPSFTF